MKNSEYTPPYTLTDKIINLIYKISESLTELAFLNKEKANFNLEKEVEDKNLKELFSKNENSNEDLMDIHRLLMEGSIEDAGTLRTKTEGSFSGGGANRLSPPAGMIPKLLRDLFMWLEDADDVHPLIKSCVFHFEFEYIQPFSDGNGRVGRMWQSLILYKWKPIFAVLPLEEIVKNREDEYLEILAECDKSADSKKLIEFSLDTILQAIVEYSNSIKAKKTSSSSSDEFDYLLQYCKESRTRDEIQKFMKLNTREQLRKEILKPLLDKGLLKMTMPDKPRSPKQKFYS